MSGESSGPGGRAVQPTKRKHSIKQVVFSYSHNETETSGREMKNPIRPNRRQRKSSNTENSFLNRYGGLDHVVEDEHRDRICFIHNHKIVRAVKVYINIYHLWKKWLNRALRSVGLGGGYHTAIEISGKEYHFGGCPDMDSGIFESKPLHRIKNAQEPVDTLTMSREDWTGIDLALQMGPLKERHVVGLWSGTEADFDLLLRHMKEKEHWKGLNYKLLTFNCNHFAKSVCDLLLKHSKYFHAAKGMTSSEKMVPSYLFRLPNIVKSRCLTQVVGDLDEDELLSTNDSKHAFSGRARYISRSCSPPQPPVTEIYNTSRSHEACSARDKDRRQSLPELRNLRIQFLDQRQTHPKKATSKEKDWGHNTTSFSLLQTDQTERISLSGPEHRSFFATEELDEHFADKPISNQSQRHATTSSVERVAVSTSSNNTDQILSLSRWAQDSCPRYARTLKAIPRQRSCSVDKLEYSFEKSRHPKLRDSISEEHITQPHLSEWNSPMMLSSGSLGGMTDMVTSMEERRSGVDSSTRSIQSALTKSCQS